MKKLSPAPISTPISTPNGNTSLPWSIWLREASDALVESTVSKPFQNNGISYTNVGKICYVNMKLTLDKPMVFLPYDSENDRYLTYYVAGVRYEVLLQRDSNMIQLPLAVEILLNDYYWAKLP